MPITQTTTATAAGSVVSTQITLADTSAHALPSYTGCKRFKLMAPVDASGVGTNTKPVFYGDASAQYDWISADGQRDNYVHWDDASKCYIKGAAGDKINIRVEF